MEEHIRLLSVILFLTLFMQGQTVGSKADAEQTSLTVHVTDNKGAALAYADVERLDSFVRGIEHITKTDQSGIALLQKAPRTVIVRHAGFRSERATADENPLKVQLHPTRMTLPVCAPDTSCLWDYGSLCLPISSRVKVKVITGKDDDYVQAWYCVRSWLFRDCISHGVGLNWSSGRPSSSDVRESTNLDDTLFLFGEIPVVASRGEIPKNSWRFLGTYGESMSYDHALKATRSQLDRLLDTACFRPLEPTSK